MCGVIGLICERSRADFGQIAGRLLGALEYRGYDSTGAAIQDDTRAITLRKGVGAPSVMVRKLGIDQLSGRIFCGQVRWATFGAVDDVNAQPHEVACRTHVYGAHNGNITNTGDLATWLAREGHTVRSDNDGEMVVHVVEHAFASRLTALDVECRGDATHRRRAMRSAIVDAGAILEGSFAAVIVDPVSQVLWALKKGSSLYFGFGSDDVGGAFAIASSDLSAVLDRTRMLVPLEEGEFIEFDATRRSVYAMSGVDAPTEERDVPLDRKPKRSRLRAHDTGLAHPFDTFMAKEIDAQEATTRAVVEMFRGGSPMLATIRTALNALSRADCAAMEAGLERVRDAGTDAATQAAFFELVRSDACARLLSSTSAMFREAALSTSPAEAKEVFRSSEAALFSELVSRAKSEDERRALRALDAFVELQEVSENDALVTEFCKRCIDTIDRHGRIFVVCCGSSFHAAKAASLFFSEHARADVVALLPGEFRGQYADTLRDGDLFVSVSQSGETKDLVDAVNLVIATGFDIGRVAIVNNVNSTLAQEKSHVAIPLRCGPEIAVPATKSFVNQLAVLFCLAWRLGEARRARKDAIMERARTAAVGDAAAALSSLPSVIRRTIDATAAKIDEAAEFLHLRPSMHILATRLSAVALEGALKIREVVLNHAEGFEGSEFKHGPNTILGFNTIFGPEAVGRLLDVLGSAIEATVRGTELEGLAPGALAKKLGALPSAIFAPKAGGFNRSSFVAALASDYPLIYVTGPDRRDVDLTISQINTHKIRGASTIVIAEPEPRLRKAVEARPAKSETYRSIYIELPETGDTLLAMFSATVALQCLALAMSTKKKAYLDALGIRDHGVHPDVPKNVSKSITVD